MIQGRSIVVDYKYSLCIGYSKNDFASWMRFPPPLQEDRIGR